MAETRRPLGTAGRRVTLDPNALLHLRWLLGLTGSAHDGGRCEPDACDLCREIDDATKAALDRA